MTYQRNETPEPLASATPITEAFDALMPEPAGYRTRFRSEPEMIGHYPWTYAEAACRRRKFDRPECEYEDLYTADQLREAIRAATERAAKAVEGVKPYAAITHVVEAEMRRRCAAAIRASSGREGT
jgi:beta-phosphoglucomutase-like phosphatase (HAD superfamily)